AALSGRVDRAFAKGGSATENIAQSSIAASIVTEQTKIAEPPIAFIDLQAQRHRLGTRIDEAIARVLTHGQYIIGPEVTTPEADLGRFCGAREVISCANGTDALGLVLLAKGVKAGDAILCPSFTFAATAEVVVWTGATPIFLDVHPDTFNTDPRSI